MLPRTIDKSRAQLSGGNSGTYTIKGSMNVLPGLSLVMLEGIGVTEERLRQVVADAVSEEEVSTWLRRNSNLSQRDSLNAKLMGRKVSDLLKVVPIEMVEKIYPLIGTLPEGTSTFDVILQDDRLMFPECAPSAAN